MRRARALFRAKMAAKKMAQLQCWLERAKIARLNALAKELGFSNRGILIDKILTDFMEQHQKPRKSEGD